MTDTAVEAVRQRLLGQNLNWWKGNKARLSQANINELRKDFNIFYNPYSERFSNLRKSRSMPCTKCNDMGKFCTGVAPAMCPQCAVAGYSKEDCVYLDTPLELSAPAWYGRGQVAAGGGGAGGAANAPIQPAVPNRSGAGLAAIRRPLGRGSPTGMKNENVNEENVNEENGVNSNASRDPNATEAEIAAGKAKKQARRNKAARLEAASALNAGNESAKAVQAMAAAAGAGAGGKRKRKSRKQTLKRKQKFTRKQK